MPKTILIVEDEIFVAMDIERILADAGYIVTAIAADRRSALEATDHPDLAFVDINLRDGQTGPSIACDLAERGTKVVYVTANPAQIDPVANTAIGYIRKPFSEGAIRAAAELASKPVPPAVPPHSEITLFDPAP
ncbi:MAG: response regulator [Sphingomicrobium sp.]